MHFVEVIADGRFPEALKRLELLDPLMAAGPETVSLRPLACNQYCNTFMT